ncbi:SSI family serine proteinase inhibitor [Streptomyces sp. JHA26]|uniref:SSI family serine proteinase inhibitor n=1 Tax=Streptomyces sp. JHA26 TaxID=1917143 RepID=UPI00098AFE86|nr:SSI family serine proteinase inhibitor [Streptomyces sp. JHA26]
MPLITRLVAARLLGAAAVSVAVLVPLVAGPAAAHADPVPRAGAGAGALMPPPVRAEDRAGDHLTVTVRDAGAGADGTYELHCHPDGGSHPDPAGACAVLDRGTRWGQDAFAPVPEGSVCTLQYGGPATAHVTGVWAGRPVDARFDRGDGCRVSRWNRLVPLLPDLRAPAGA